MVEEKNLKHLRTERRTGLVVTLAGGSIKDWITSIEKMLIAENIIESGPVFIENYILSDNILGKDGRTDLVLIFDSKIEIDMDKLQVWKAKFRDIYDIGDFIANYGGEFSS